MDETYSAYKHQRSRALAKGIGWELEYWEWLQIWQDSGHLHERGVHKGQWVMGRNGDVGPYAVWNVKIIRQETNSGLPHKRNKINGLIKRRAPRPDL